MCIVECHAVRILRKFRKLTEGLLSRVVQASRARSGAILPPAAAIVVAAVGPVHAVASLARHWVVRASRALGDALLQPFAAIIMAAVGLRLFTVVGVAEI